jgi:transcriptional regulator with XRE-family HTH domain
MAKKKKTPGLREQLKEAIRQSGKSLYQLAQATGIDSGRLSRFLRGERGLSFEALEKIWAALDLRIAGAAPGPGLEKEDD